MPDVRDPDDPGLLPALRGIDVSKAESSLPPAVTATVAEMIVVIDSEHQGRVRVYCERTALRKGKQRWFTWVARYAEKAPGAALGVQPPL